MGKASALIFAASLFIIGSASADNPVASAPASDFSMSIGVCMEMARQNWRDETYLQLSTRDETFSRDEMCQRIEESASQGTTLTYGGFYINQDNRDFLDAVYCSNHTNYELFQQQLITWESRPNISALQEVNACVSAAGRSQTPRFEYTYQKGLEGTTYIWLSGRDLTNFGGNGVDRINIEMINMRCRFSDKLRWRTRGFSRIYEVGEDHWLQLICQRPSIDGAYIQPADASNVRFSESSVNVSTGNLGEVLTLTFPETPETFTWEATHVRVGYHSHGPNPGTRRASEPEGVSVPISDCRSGFTFGHLTNNGAEADSSYCELQRLEGTDRCQVRAHRLYQEGPGGTDINDTTPFADRQTQAGTSSIFMMCEIKGYTYVRRPISPDDEVEVE